MGKVSIHVMRCLAVVSLDDGSLSLPKSTKDSGHSSPSFSDAVSEHAARELRKGISVWYDVARSPEEAEERSD